MSIRVILLFQLAGLIDRAFAFRERCQIQQTNESRNVQEG